MYSTKPLFLAFISWMSKVGPIYIIVSYSLCSQFTTKDSELKAQLHSVGTLLPTVQMHLILCTTFTSTANKHEFLTLAYQLIDRLTALAHLTYPMRWIQCSFKSTALLPDPKNWARGNRKTLNRLKMMSKLNFENFKLKSHEEYLNCRTYFVL